MKRKPKTWKQSVESNPGYAEWTFGKGVRSLTRADDIAKKVSESLKGIYSKYERFEKARKFARRMRERAEYIREYGCRVPGQQNFIPRRMMAALCMGVGDGNNRVMIQRYEAAAKAAERFCRR